MKTQVKQNKKEITLLQLSQELKKLKKEISTIQDNTMEIGEHLDSIGYKLRKDIPFIFINENEDELFKTFNLNVLPRVNEKMNLRPSPDSCCLNIYLMKEFDLTEEQLTDHIINKNYFSFIISDIATNITIIDSHPENEWDDANCVNFIEEEYNMVYLITLRPNNICKKQVLIEKINRN